MTTCPHCNRQRCQCEPKSREWLDARSEEVHQQIVAGLLPWQQEVISRIRQGS